MSPKLTRSFAAAAICGASLLAACGGDGDGGSAGAPRGSDEDYLEVVCDATSEFAGRFLAAALSSGAAADPEDEDAQRELVEELRELFVDFRDDIADAPRPQDLDESHDAFVADIESVIDALDDADNIEELDNLDLGEGFEFDGEIEVRLTAAAANVEECEGANLFSE